VNLRINIEWKEIKRIIIKAGTEAEEQRLQTGSNGTVTALRELRLQQSERRR
jgi:hypothetical protein